ncbi:Exocyst complex component SEC3A [Hibiscus syriacus]|uniref:Exocyst complex component SEC3A n=1 Tax=Hibiscus syriacus TaxID=106335 RepID=A0A6A2X342_HIBSY|nr:Exocyst complex component SEC3A [Hibiscus syriacus]
MELYVALMYLTWILLMQICELNGLPSHFPSFYGFMVRQINQLVVVKEKQAELENLKTTFLWRASAFLKNYFASLVDSMMSDKSNFSRRGQLKQPDHADCDINAGHILAFCNSSTSGSRSGNSTETSALSDAYAKVLMIFIPLLVDESSFFAHFMCFEVPALIPPEGVANGNKSGSTDDDLGIMDIDDNVGKADMQSLNKSLQDCLMGFKYEDFYAVVDWASKIDPLCCISMRGTTKYYLSGQKSDTAGFVCVLLGYLESKISMQFGRFVDEACHQIERNEHNVGHTGAFIPRFATLATRMEQYIIQGQSRDLVDKAYTKLVAFFPLSCALYSLYDLANFVPTLAKFYQQASEASEQASMRLINMIIYTQFERLFEFARKIEDLILTVSPEEVSVLMIMIFCDVHK